MLSPSTSSSQSLNHAPVAAPIPNAAETSPLTTATLPARVTMNQPPSQKGEPLPLRSTQETLALAWAEAFGKLFAESTPERPRMSYDVELREAAKKVDLEPQSFLSSAIQQLKNYPGKIETDSRGRILDPHSIGSVFSQVYELATSKVDISIATSAATLHDPAFPLGKKMCEKLGPIVDGGEAVTVMLTKEPPARAIKELSAISKDKFGGIISLWANQELWDKVGISPDLRDYLTHATVRIVCTGKDAHLNSLARVANEALESKGGFEDANWTRMIKSATQMEQAHSLKATLAICFPVIGAIKLLEGYAPGAVHAVGGVLDDFFGGIVPDVSQSMGKGELTWRERFKEATPTLVGGLASLPAAAAFGWGSAVLHASSHSPAVHAAAGVLFALACSAGTIGTSIGAFSTAYRKLSEMESDPILGETARGLGTSGKVMTAIQESVLNVPFRIGHTVIGVPLQIGLGVAAGVGGFFHNSLFIITEGMLETVLGAGTAFGWPSISGWFRNRQLKNIEP